MGTVSVKIAADHEIKHTAAMCDPGDATVRIPISTKPDPGCSQLFIKWLAWHRGQACPGILLII